jgi:hypothetical protein
MNAPVGALRCPSTLALEAGDEQPRICVHANGAGNAVIPHMNFAEAAPTKLL